MLLKITEKRFFDRNTLYSPIVHRIHRYYSLFTVSDIVHRVYDY